MSCTVELFIVVVVDVQIKSCLARTSKQETSRLSSVSGAISQRASPVTAINRSGGFSNGGTLMLPSKPIAIPFLLSKSRQASHGQGSLEGLNQVRSINLLQVLTGDHFE